MEILIRKTIHSQSSVNIFDLPRHLYTIRAAYKLLH